MSVLDADPELGRWLSPDAFLQARRHAVAQVAILRVGFWEPPPAVGSPSDHLGYLVLEGLLAREEKLAGCTATELLGPGELLQPWNQQPDEILIPRQVAWEALEPTRLAVLGPAFVNAIDSWPRLATALLDRAMRGRDRLATHRALCQLSPVDRRLHVLFWQLAERWGHVTAGSVILPLRLQHETLGRLAAAKRSTVTLALQKLDKAELVHRRDDGAWVLTGGPPQGTHATPAPPIADEAYPETDQSHPLAWRSRFGRRRTAV